MVLDVSISAALAILTMLMGYLGVHLTMHPAESTKARLWYKTGFATCAVFMVGLVIWQGVRNGMSQLSLARQLSSGTTRISELSGQVSSLQSGLSETKKQVTDARTDLRVESARRQQAEQDMGMMVKKTGVDTRAGVAEDIRKSPITVDVQNGKESFKMGVNLMKPTSGESAPYITEFLLTANQTVTPIRMVVECDGDIVDAHGRLMGSGVVMGGGWGGRFSPHAYGVGISAPAWTPSSPLVLTVRSNSKELGNCRFAEQ
jgi:hypothetical protein